MKTPPAAFHARVRDDGAEDFDPARIPLEPVKVHRFGPLLFAALDPETPTFEELFPSVTEH